MVNTTCKLEVQQQVFMDKFETKATEGYPLKPLLWERSIYDIFMVWTHGEAQLEAFMKYLNSQHLIWSIPTIAPIEINQFV